MIEIFKMHPELQKFQNNEQNNNNNSLKVNPKLHQNLEQRCLKHTNRFLYGY